MSKVQDLSIDDKELLLEVVLNSKYAIELVGSKIADLENNKGNTDEDQLKKLNVLYDHLTAKGL